MQQVNHILYVITVHYTLFPVITKGTPLRAPAACAGAAACSCKYKRACRTDKKQSQEAQVDSSEERRHDEHKHPRKAAQPWNPAKSSLLVLCLTAVDLSLAHRASYRFSLLPQRAARYSVGKPFHSPATDSKLEASLGVGRESASPRQPDRRWACVVCMRCVGVFFLTYLAAFPVAYRLGDTTTFWRKSRPRRSW